MAAAITTTGTTLEAQVLEVIQAANNAERNLSEELNQDRFTVTLDLESVPPTITLSATLTVNVSNSGEQKMILLPPPL